jgi:hypothetical protein
MHPTLLSRRYAAAKSMQSSYLTLSGCVLLSQGGPGVRLAWQRRQRQELRRQRCTARRIGGCDNHCDDNDAQHDRASHDRRGRDVRYARTIKETQAKSASGRIFGAATPLGALRHGQPNREIKRRFTKIYRCLPICSPEDEKGSIRSARTRRNFLWFSFFYPILFESTTWP